MHTIHGRAVSLAALLCAAATLLTTSVVRADETTYGFDAQRANVLWGGELSPGVVASPLVARRFDTALTTAQVYAQPVIYAGVVVVAAEDDQLFGVDQNTGAVLWHRTMGVPDTQVPTTCPNQTVQIGSTATPVVDPATGLVYVTARDVSGGSAVWKMLAFDVRTGSPAGTWRIEGTASNAPFTFDPVLAGQRTALLLSSGQVFAAFASYCDWGPYRGWVAGVGAVGSAAPGAVHLWTDEADSSGSLGGIWQSGGGLASDGPGQLLVVSGNGIVPAQGAGGATPAGGYTPPPPDLGNSVIRLAVQPDGSLRALDFFASHDAATQSQNDADLGAGSAVLPPDGFGQVPGHPHLLITGGKDARLYVLDRDSLGGRGTSLAQDGVVTPAPLPTEWFGHAATYNGDGGGWIYLHVGGELSAYRLQGTQLARVGAAQGFDFGAGSPVVTAPRDGQALVWELDSVSSRLRAFRAVPSGGLLEQVLNVVVRPLTKFSQPAVDGDRVFVATNDGHLVAFGPPVSPFSAVEGSDGAAYVRRAGTGFSGLGGRLTGAPAVVSLPAPGGGRTPLLLVTGADGTLWARTPTTSWYRFGSATDRCLDNPAAVVVGGTLLVACQGTDRALWRSTTAVGSTPAPLSGGFRTLGGRLVNGPALAAVAGSPTLLVNGTDGRVWSRAFDGSSGWQPQGWRCIGHPALATEPGGRTVFACQGADHAVWLASAVNRLPVGAHSLGFAAIDGVGLAAGSEGTLLSIEGPDAALWNSWLLPSGASSEWTRTGGVLRQGVGSADVP